MEYGITSIDLERSPNAMLAAADRLLEQEGIRRDKCLDYLCALTDEEGRPAAVGGLFGNTMRCFAVSGEHRGEGLLNLVVTHLIDVQASRGNLHLFLYTKPETAQFFQDLGFHEIARVEGKLVFMENRRNGFPGYLKDLEKTARSGRAAAIVMNANPFTLGHQYLAEQASAACDVLHIFVVSEDLSLVPFPVRRRLVEEGTAHLPNVVIHDCGPYLISAATFPGYFLKDEVSVAEGQAKLDTALFSRIASTLGITERWVGEEPFSEVTALYNRILSEELPKAGIRCRIVPRRQAEGAAISASEVRRRIQSGDLESLSSLLPASTLRYFMSSEAAGVIEKIRAAEEVTHH